MAGSEVPLRPGVFATLEDSAGSLVVRSTHAMQVRIEKSSGVLSIVDQATGSELRFAQPLCLLSEQGDTLRVGPVLSWRHEGDTVLVAMGAGQDGCQALLAVAFPLRSSCQITLSASAGAATGARLALRAAGDEHSCGGGERFARVDQRGLRFPCWADDQAVSQSGGHPWTYFPVPFFISSKGYALALHTTYRSDWDLCASSDDTVVVDIAEPRICCEFYFAGHPLTLIDLYTQRTGRPTLPPRWNNGVWRTCLGGQEAVMAEARRLRSEGIPCSALWVYDANDPRGNVGWPICKMHHSGHYDDIAETVRRLHALGYKVQTYLFPYYYEDTPYYADAEARGYFLKNADGSTFRFPFFSVTGREPYRRVASIVDFSNPEAKAWWQEAIRYILVDLGFDGWMHDFGENIPDDVVAFDGRSGRALHNAYPVLYQQAAREMCAQVKPDASFYARSGYAGSQNWLTAAWTGDQVCNWAPGEGLPSALVACLSLGISGIPFVGPDIGGYFSDSFSPGAQAFSEELWQRWAQFGALCSIMRDHLGDKPEGSAELWTSDATIACFRRYARLHLSLSPYLQLLAREAHETGAPIMRHMLLAVPNEPWAWSCDDQYMLGKDLLVAPVLVEGARSRTVRLPDGLWVDFWEGLPYQGGRVVEVAAPLERIPLFWRAGALVPALLNPADTIVAATDPAVRSADDDINLLLCLPAQWPSAGPRQGRTALALVDGTQFACTWSPEEIKLSCRGGSPRRHALTIPCDWRAVKATVGGEPAQLQHVASLPELGQGYRNAQAWQVCLAGGQGESKLVITGVH